MCAIGGIIQLDKRKVFNSETKLDVIGLLTHMQQRGTDSWGMYLEKSKGHNHHLNCGIKDDTIPGELFKMSGDFDDFGSDKDGVINLDHTNLVLMHTRNSTQGSPDDNKNNHPFNTKDFILAHNGCIYNDEDLIKEYKLNTDIKCDSYVIVALIQYYYDKGENVKNAIKNALKEISGGFSCWLYHKEKGELYFFRNGKNPLEYYIDEERDILMFASESKYIVDTYKTDVSITDTITSDEDKIYKLKGKQLIEIGEFESPVITTTTRTNNLINRTNTSCSTIPYGSDYNVDKYDKMIAKLVEFFEQFNSASTFHSIVFNIDDDTNILVRSNSLNKLLKKYKYKDYEKGSRGSWQLYTIPKDDMFEITKGFLNEVNGVKDVEVPTYTNLTDFLKQIKSFCKDANIIFNDTPSGIELVKTTGTNKRAENILRKNGYVFGKKNQTSIGHGKIVRDKMNKVMRAYYLVEGEICAN